MIKEDISNLRTKDIVTRICDECSIETRHMLSNIISSRSRIKHNKDLCHKCSYKYRILTGCEGSKSVNWKGGMNVSDGGYLRYTSLYDENGVSTKLMGEYVHKIIYGNYIGRKLTREEQVHHIDMNKLNNNIANLFYCKNKTEHHKIHSQMEDLALSLFNKYIYFDKKNKEYTLRKVDIKLVKNKKYKLKPTYRKKEKTNKYYDHVYISYKKHYAYHRYIYEFFYKIKLIKDQHIHHINGDTLDNDINNLIMLNRSEHKNAHNSLQKCIIQLYSEGVVKFNNGRYYV